MGPFEFFTIVVLFLGLPGLVLYNIRKMKEAKYGAGSWDKESGGTMRRSELEALIEVAVEDAVAPLEARIAELEAGTPMLNPAAPIIDLEEDHEEVEETVRARPRSRH